MCVCGGGVLCYAVRSGARWLQWGIWKQSLWDTTKQRGSKHTRVLWAAFKRTELHFNLKQACKRGDVGQPMTQGEKYPKLKLNQVYWCTLQALTFISSFLCIKVAFLINSCTSSPDVPPASCYFPLQDFGLFLNRITKTSQGRRQQWHEEARHNRFLLSVLQVTAVISVQDKWKRWNQDK